MGGDSVRALTSTVLTDERTIRRRDQGRDTAHSFRHLQGRNDRLSQRQKPSSADDNSPQPSPGGGSDAVAPWLLVSKTKMKTKTKTKMKIPLCASAAPWKRSSPRGGAPLGSPLVAPPLVGLPAVFDDDLMGDGFPALIPPRRRRDGGQEQRQQGTDVAAQAHTAPARTRRRTASHDDLDMEHMISPRARRRTLSLREEVAIRAREESHAWGGDADPLFCSDGTLVGVKTRAKRKGSLLLAVVMGSGEGGE